MPCFKGLAVSIHTPEGPLPEYSIQKQSRASRISSYIPVPPAKIPKDSLTGKPEQSTFAVSITLLTPGLTVPYSAPKATTENPYPKPRIVGGLPGYNSGPSERSNHGPVIPPYVPRTLNPNETIAAYIYFDGRPKEEVATLLRRGEETWVNSRWVSVPESEGGGLAEREFLFREVGLERWLNGLDLEGSKDKQERIERRQRRLEKKEKEKKAKSGEQNGLDSDEEDMLSPKKPARTSVLRYGGDFSSPVEDMQEDNILSDSDSDDEPPEPEAAGQIKIALFRVLASGEIKRGEYSPQFDAHDDDDEATGDGAANGGDQNVDHTTSFAKPKTLDPKTISTQTVTGLDTPDSPYAVFTFMYRGEKQLQKMRILPAVEAEKKAEVPKKLKGPNIPSFGPLKQFGTVGFSGYRDSGKKNKDAKDEDAMDSDNDDDDDRAKRTNGDDEVEIKQENGNLLSPEDAKRTGELADGVQRIKLKRQHSVEPLADAASTRKSPHLKNADSPGCATPQSVNSTTAHAGTPPPDAASLASPSEISGTIGSPHKKQRPSLPGFDEESYASLGPPANAINFAPSLQPTTFQPPASANPVKTEPANPDSGTSKIEDDEEL